MITLVDAINKKYEKLTEGHIFGPCISRSYNKSNSNFHFPSRTLTMDCQNISYLGSETDLQNVISNVCELDLSGNKLHLWDEVCFNGFLVLYI